MNNQNHSQISNFFDHLQVLPQGQFVTRDNERYYAIYDVDKMAPFFISLISPDDHWLFVSSTGALTAGRVSPETALFPYVTVDRIHESGQHTGPKTVLRVIKAEDTLLWEPFNTEHFGLYRIQRNLYRNTLGNKICFEEINLDLGLRFQYRWESSDSFGFCRSVTLHNQSENVTNVEILDGLQNILPAGTPRYTQTNSSNLVDAYKWTELDAESKLAMFTLYSGITDRAEPCESLQANSVYSLGLEDYQVLLSSEQLNGFRAGKPVVQDRHKRGVRGAYLIQTQRQLAPNEQCDWQLVMDIEQSQADLVAQIKRLNTDPVALANALQASIASGSDRLARIMAASDGLQATGEELVAEHHYANTLYNVLRGGIFANQYKVTKQDILSTVAQFNQTVFADNQTFLNSLPEHLHFADFLQQVTARGDMQLLRLAQEYLPITFGRRHGDPSRPWNQFAINLKDEQDQPLLSYQGNWRDIFQNWEALSFSYPEFAEGMIAKFVNASTMDGYNPYRITKQGIDWEVEEPDDPWSYIGYWGDHQIIYLLKLLEVSQQFSPEKLGQLLFSDTFCYANVPYKIKPFAQLIKNAKDTVEYDEQLASDIEARVASLGADGKMVMHEGNQVYQVNLLEKLLVPLLTKLSNLVLDGGIWLNTQRPEWNDANNALVGQGLSMVTLYYMRRYTAFMQTLLADQDTEFALSSEVALWLSSTATTLAETAQQLNAQHSVGQPVTAELRYSVMARLGEAASDYRQTVYQQQGFSGKQTVSLASVRALLQDALVAIDHCIATNRTGDGLFHAYNLVSLEAERCEVTHLYPMLEGQVSALSTGHMNAAEACQLLDSLFDSDIYRADQNTFMLYPDRAQTPFLAKNQIAQALLSEHKPLQQLLDDEQSAVVTRDDNGVARFDGKILNAGDLAKRLLSDTHFTADERQSVLDAYERVFNHQAFTGRSGGMFGFEGLGCIYWHMVSKLLLATCENFYRALANEESAALVERLGQLYYRVREGIGFNKTPLQYGAFPTDPYSHTPKHAGAQQPGMTGQVKEELICRFAELGIRVDGGQAHILPALLRAQEFSREPHQFTFVDVQEQWQTLALEANTLAFTWCQVPVVYKLKEHAEASLQLDFADGNQVHRDALALTVNESKMLFKRSAELKQITVTLTPSDLLAVS